MSRVHLVPMSLVSILALTLGGCGDDPSTSDSAGGTTTGSGAAEDSVDPSTPSSPSTDPTTTDGEGGNSMSGPDTTGASEGESATTAVTSATDDATSDPGTTADISGTTTEPGDTTGDDTGAPMDECQAPGKMVPCDDASDDVFKSIGLNCSDDPSSAIPIKNPTINAPDKASYRVATRFGVAQSYEDPALPAWGPKEGYRFLVIGTGKFPAVKPDGSLSEPNGSDSEANGNPDELTQLPGVMKHKPGSNKGKGGTPFMNCDGTNDCSDTLDAQWNLVPDNIANDLFYMSFDVTTPAGTHGYMFDFVFFSEEYPVYVNTDFNDMFVVWSTSETFTGNVTFIEGQPLTVTALQNYMIVQPQDPVLSGTGFLGDEEGAATGWFTAKASAEPGETFTVAVSIFDMGDTVWDTVGILDNFRWDCKGCVPSEVDSCGVEPQ